MFLMIFCGSHDIRPKAAKERSSREVKLDDLYKIVYNLRIVMLNVLQLKCIIQNKSLTKTSYS